MTNVVVAILLDNYLEAIDKDKEQNQQIGEDIAENERLTVHIEIQKSSYGHIPYKHLEQLRAFLDAFEKDEDNDTRTHVKLSDPPQPLTGPEKFMMVDVNLWSIELVGKWLAQIGFGAWVE